ncbi:MAG: hypothetical protein ACHQIK_06010 [Candidatus Acidiferrales bacterium]
MNISDRLNELMLSYRREARRCLRAKAYHAATVMQVAAFEAGLQAMCFLYPVEVKRTGVYANKHFRGKRNKGLEFSLNQLINIADELRWFPAKRVTWAGKRATVAGFSHEIRKVRNNVHPGVWARDRADPIRFTKGVYGVVDEVIDVANSWLLHRIEKNLLKTMKREDRKKTASAANVVP